jgi:hypothetical protein
MFENTVLRDTFQIKMEEETGGEKCILRSFVAFTGEPDITRVSKSRRIKYFGYVERMGRREMLTRL